jgi:hypothetical protein
MRYRLCHVSALAKHGICTLPVVEGAQVINPKHVVGMSVGDEDGIERLQPGAQRLLTEINRRVNEYLRSLMADK